ncbi:MAG: hypothetical protein ACXVDC_16335 [Bacteroidia bacterium]
MKNNKKEPVQVVLTYNPNSADRDNLRAKVVTKLEVKDGLKKLDDNHKLVRRYSFDDNGGGYLGL